MTWRDEVGRWLLRAGWLGVMCFAISHAFRIRMHAIETFGYVIHEFDPWFNYRATKYLADKGWHSFFHWFDYMSWYPLGRPVGTTIYPGMQITSVSLWKILNWLREPLGLGRFWKLAATKSISLNDVCCLIPAWFGGSATTTLALLTAECSRSYGSSIFAGLIMAIVPAHLMRSVGGGYDNESVAITAMCLTFLAWCRSLRGEPGDDWLTVRSDVYVFGALAGVCYTYMVAVWGGYVFVLNMVVAHALVLTILFRYTEKLRISFSLFFLLGTAGATRVPVVGWRPFRDMEQLSAVVAFLGLNILGFVLRRWHRQSGPPSSWLAFALRGVVARVLSSFVLALVCGSLVVALYPRGYFGPLSARVRGLFVKHTRTGNPLVDSVAEHQPASTAAYEQYLHYSYNLAPYGLVLSVCFQRPTDASLFLWTYAAVTVFFCSKMARLIILLSPAASALGGIALGVPFDNLALYALADLFPSLPCGEAQQPKTKPHSRRLGRLMSAALFFGSQCIRIWRSKPGAVCRICAAVYAARALWPKAMEFKDYSYRLSEGLSQPSIMFKARLTNGEEVLVDDYREAYLWLKSKTKKDSRVMAWWDYGYQITGIGERTTLADGNTWNHEHIATLGRILTAPENEAWEIARHLADYVLVWAGGGGDDLAKSPHMARIGNSVYHDFCPDDPTCGHFGFYHGGVPSPSMRQSLLYKLTQHGLQPGAELNSTRWKHAYSTRFGKVRIFKIVGVAKESKAWVANATNRLCDAPGSWYCPGQYPPAVKWLINKRKPFRQLEDFNTERDESAKKYTEEYHRRMEESANYKRGDRHGAHASKAAEKLNLRDIGCYRLESQLPQAKDYAGGETATSAHAAAAFAGRLGRKYVAISRVHSDGHVFAFDKPPAGPKLDDAGCRRECLDDPKFACGCADAGCPSSVKRRSDEEYLRRWIVYAIASSPKKSAKASSSSSVRKKKSSPSPPKSEL